MPRTQRLHVVGGFYHVILRGNHRAPIFSGEADYRRLSALVAEVTARFTMRVHAYCWMTNHVHLLIQVGDAPVGVAMQVIASRHARSVQRQIPTTGHLFERRYRSILVDADAYLLQLVRYIHLNPVKAGLVVDPADYPWSGHRTYVGLETTAWLTTDFALRLFSADRASAQRAYNRFVQDAAGQPADDSLETGRTDEPRVLGDDKFLSGLKCRNQSPVRLTLCELIKTICRSNDLEPADLVRTGRHRAAARVRALVVHHALAMRIATLAELSRYFGRSDSTLAETRDRYREKLPDLFAAPVDLD